MDVLLVNLSLETALMAILAGVVLSMAGALFAPDWAFERIPAHYPLAWLSALSVAWTGFLFYVLQTIGAFAAGDPLWPRIVGRFGLFLVMALAHGLTFNWCLRHIRPRRPKWRRRTIGGN